MAGEKLPARAATFFRFLAFMVFAPVLAVVLSPLYSGHPEKLAAPDVVRVRMRSGLPVDQTRVDAIVMPWLESHVDEIQAHARYVSVSLAVRGSGGGGASGGAEDPLWNYYRRLRASAAGQRRDAACYALAVCEDYRDSLNNAVALLDEIATPELPYVHLARGGVLRELNRYAEADSEFRKEIQIGQLVQPAVAALAFDLAEEGDWHGISDLRADPRLRKWIPKHVIRASDAHAGRLIAYIGDLFRSQAAPFVPTLLLAALYTT